MRLVFWIVVGLILGTSAAFARTSPQDQFFFPLYGPEAVDAGATGTFTGELSLDPARSRDFRGVENGIVGVGNQRIDLLLDGKLAAVAYTASVLGADRWSGRFAASIGIPLGAHEVVAVAYRGTPAEVRSPVRLVYGVTVPSAPVDLAGGPGAVMGEARLAWSPPLDAGGHVSGYRVFRQDPLDGSWGWRGDAPTTSFVDRGEAGVEYAYRVTAWNPAGESPPSEVALVRTKEAPPADALDVDVVRYRVCNGYPDANCQFVEPGGTAYAYTTTLYVHALVQGTLTDGGNPVAGAIVSGIATIYTPRYCPPDEVCAQVFDTHEFAFEATTGTDGVFSAWVGAARHDRFDLRCHTVYGHADAGYLTLAASGESTFRYCDD